MLRSRVVMSLWSAAPVLSLLFGVLLPGCSASDSSSPAASDDIYGNSDAIDASSITWTGTDPSRWVQRARLEGLAISNPTRPRICFSTYIPSDWPMDVSRKYLADLWVVGEVNGSLHASQVSALMGEAVGPARTQCVTMQDAADRNTTPFAQAQGGAIQGWRPKHGEAIGFLITPILRMRANQEVPKERSAIVTTTYP